MLWDDDTIRARCREGTFQEFNAYLQSGYTLEPTPIFGAWRSMAEIAKTISNKYGITVEELKNDSRELHLVRARKEFCNIAYFKLGRSSSAIGRFLKRDRTTIIHHLGKRTWQRQRNTS